MRLQLHALLARCSTAPCRAPASPPARAGAAVAGGAVCLWLVQEWAIHARLLHSAWPWFGAGPAARARRAAPAARRPAEPAMCRAPCRTGGRAGWADAPAGAMRRLDGQTRAAAPGQTLYPYTLYPVCGAGRDLHEDHHNAPYFHVCIDGVELVAPVMALAALAFGAAFHGAPALGRTATLAYWASGLAYLWTHFFVHLPIAPRSRYAQAVRRHHMLCAHPSRGFAGL